MIIKENINSAFLQRVASLMCFTKENNIKDTKWENCVSCDNTADA